MRLTTEIFVNWLKQEIIDANYSHNFPIFFGRQPDNPDRCITVFKQGPGQERYEGAFEEIPFKILTRGRSESLSDAEDLALFIDKVLYDRKNFMLGDIYVTSLWAFNDLRQLSMVDRNSRYQFSADYFVLAAKEP